MNVFFMTFIELNAFKIKHYTIEPTFTVYRNNSVYFLCVIL